MARRADAYLWAGPCVGQEEMLEKKLSRGTGVTSDKERRYSRGNTAVHMEDVIDWQSQIASEAKLTVIT